MKNKILFTILFSAILFTASPAIGAYTYERDPPEYDIYNPVDFTLTWDDFDADVCTATTSDAWVFRMNQAVGGGYVSPIYNTTSPRTFTATDLPFDIYHTIYITCRKPESASTDPFDGDWINGIFVETGNNLFEIGEAPPPPPPPPAFNIFSISGMATSSLAYVGRLFTDLQVIIILLIGIPIAFMAIKKTTGLVKKNFR